MSATTRIAIIGCGNMGAALAVGLSRLTCTAVSLTGFDPDSEKLACLKAEAGLVPAVSPLEAAREADIILLCVKPKFITEVAREISSTLKASQSALRQYSGRNMTGSPGACARRAPNDRQSIQHRIGP